MMSVDKDSRRMYSHLAAPMPSELANCPRAGPLIETSIDSPKQRAGRLSL
jgi:hypothetical protein